MAVLMLARCRLCRRGPTVAKLLTCTGSVKRGGEKPTVIGPPCKVNADCLSHVGRLLQSLHHTTAIPLRSGGHCKSTGRQCQCYA